MRRMKREQERERERDSKDQKNCVICYSCIELEGAIGGRTTRRYCVIIMLVVGRPGEHVIAGGAIVSLNLKIFFGAEGPKNRSPSQNNNNHTKCNMTLMFYTHHDDVQFNRQSRFEDQPQHQQQQHPQQHQGHQGGGGGGGNHQGGGGGGGGGPMRGMQRQWDRRGDDFQNKRRRF